MKESVTSRDKLNAAGAAGIALSVIPVLYYYLYMRVYSASVLDGVETSHALSLILSLMWVVKLVLGIVLLKLFMQSFSRRYPGVTASDAVKFGVLSSAASGLIIGAFTMAYHLLIDPEMISKLISYLLESPYAPLISGSGSAMDSVASSYPAATLITNFFYCTLYGYVLSAILSRRIRYFEPDSESEEN